MKNQKSVWIMALVLVVLLGGAYAAYQKLSAGNELDQLGTAGQTGASGSGAQSQTDSEYQKVPDFTVVDLEGNPHSLSEFQGKPVVINFWASWCGFCVKEMPDFETLYQEFGDQVHFMMINVTDGQRETLEKASAFVEEGGYSFPVYYDVKLEASSVLDTRSLPVSYFLDDEGRLVKFGRGMLNQEKIRRGIEAVLAESEA